MHLLVSHLFILALSLAAACGAGNNKNKQDKLSPEDSIRNSGQSTSTKTSTIKRGGTEAAEPDTLYRISGTEPFWSFTVAKPQMIFTSMEGDTLFFPWQEPRQASARPNEYLQVYELGNEQELILKQAGQCPCSDGMSNKEYPYMAILILENKVLEGCGRIPPQ